jgi:hypothetical protein
MELISGIACKLYDDLHDNPYLIHYKTDYLSELLKGIHYISFTSTSIKDPYFYVISVLANALHSIYNKEAYSKPYESSLFVSFLLILFALDYKIIQLKLVDYFLLFSVCMLLFTEPLFQFKEYSYFKMLGRGIASLWYGLICTMNVSQPVLHVYQYFIGYFLCSAIIQGYSLFHKKRSFSKRKRSIQKEIQQFKYIIIDWLNWIDTTFNIHIQLEWVPYMLFMSSVLYNVIVFYMLK